MIPPLKALDLVPSGVYASAIALAVAGIGVQTVRLAGAEAKTALLEKTVATEWADRLQLVAAHNLKVGLMEATHAAQQQEIVDGFHQEKMRLQAEHRLALDRAERVRLAAAEQAARDRDAAAGDPAACQRVADRNAVLYGLVSEGFGLVEEGRNLLGGAAADITALKALIANDRAAICGGAK